MAYYTADELRERAGGTSASAARAELAHDDTTRTTYDIFVSHSLNDDVLVLGLKNELECLRLTVYIEWLEDSAVDRERVAPTTAMRLRQRTRSCRAPIHATRVFREARASAKVGA